MTPASKLSTQRKNILICRSRMVDYPEDQAMLGIRRFALSQPEWRLGFLSVAEISDSVLRDVQSWNPKRKTPRGPKVRLHPERSVRAGPVNREDLALADQAEMSRTFGPDRSGLRGPRP
jgi:hypothetical protein